MRQACWQTGIVRTAREGRQHTCPFGAVEKKQSRPAGAAGGRGNPVATEVGTIARGSQMGFYLDSMDEGIRNHTVELVHQHRFGYNRQRIQWRVLQPCMELAIERGACAREGQQLAKTRLLVAVEIAARPALPRPHLAAEAEHMRQEHQVHRPIVVLTAEDDLSRS
jgi:hypothetical protein